LQVNAADLFGIGGAWTQAWKSDPSAKRGSLVADAPINTAGVTFHSAVDDKSAVQAIRDRLRGASGSLRDALSRYARETNPLYGTTSSGGTATAAWLEGVSGRVSSFTQNFKVTKTTQQVNTQTAELQRKSSSALGLDITSPEAKSRLSSSAGLGLDVTGTSSVKVSKEEMNLGYDTSYSTNSLTFRNGGSTSASTGSLTGTYAGNNKAADATALTVTVTQGGTLNPTGILGLGQTRISLEVKDQTGEVIKTVSTDLYAGEAVSLGGDIGLSISFGQGALTTGHTSTFNVAKTPTTVDANAKFNAPAGSRPNFGAVTQVVAGSFSVNNTTIGVYADDTINTVLDRITNSAAGVTATLTGDKVTLTSKDASDQDIDVGSDSSNFVKAVRLDGTNTTRGDLRDDQRTFDHTTVFSTVTNGSFTINGQTISVVRNQDTINTVLNKINTSGAGVTASLNQATNKIEIVSNTNSEDPIAVGNDTSNFLSLAKLSTNNTVRGNIRDDQQVLAKTTQFASVATGNFTVNGVSISVNKDTDSLSSIINRINSAGANVVASYDTASDKLVFTPTNGSLSLVAGTSGFLAAAKVATGTTLTSDHANADAAFNTTGAAGPMFDPGLSVQAGSFQVNGVTIDVLANDTINSVLTKITNSAAGVTASYDSTTELVTLTKKTSGGAPISLSGDTSGFLAAVKLNGTASNSNTSVTSSAFTSVLSNMSEYAGVTNGTLTVNGTAIAINPNTTTIDGLISTIDGISGVNASIDHTTGKILIRSEATGGSLTLADTSGLLNVLHVASGTVHGSTGKGTTTAIRIGTQTTSNATQVVTDVRDALTKLNGVLTDIGKDHQGDAAFHTGAREALQSAVEFLRDEGFRGLSVVEDGDALTVEMSSDSLVNSLNVLGDTVDIARKLASLADTLDAGFADAAGWDQKPTATTQKVRLEQTSRAVLAADQTATSLLLFKSSLDPKESDEATAKTAMKAYSAQ
jgi:hypothetical protein